eukprot:173442-Chlamydomonas_euryale.AAC.1
MGQGLHTNWTPKNERGERFNRANGFTISGPSARLPTRAERGARAQVWAQVWVRRCAASQLRVWGRVAFSILHSNDTFMHGCVPATTCMYGQGTCMLVHVALTLRPPSNRFVRKVFSSGGHHGVQPWPALRTAGIVSK